MSDLEQAKQLDQDKEKRKACNLLLKRVEDAKKLFATNEVILKQLENITTQLEKIKAS